LVSNLISGSANGGVLDFPAGEWIRGQVDVWSWDEGPFRRALEFGFQNKIEVGLHGVEENPGRGVFNEGSITGKEEPTDPAPETLLEPCRRTG
jgi:hypothetical protein